MGKPAERQGCKATETKAGPYQPVAVSSAERNILPAVKKPF